jgi:outer membrane protein OmpA-like peptidoglycan-associated protein
MLKNGSVSILAVLLVLLVPGGPAGAQTYDHPLVARDPGSELSKRETKELGQYKLIVGIEESGGFESQTLEGKIDRLHYSQPRERSTQEIFRNYQQTLTGTGVEVLFTCIGDDCGPGDSAQWKAFNGIGAKTGPRARYLAGVLSTPDGDIYVALTVGRDRHQLDIIEAQPTEEMLVTSFDAAAVASDLELTGHASVHGIYFENGEAELDPASEATLEQIAEMLKQQSDLKLHIVGHTDNVGDVDANMRLSEERAKAIVQALTEDHGIDASRLDAYGVGPLAPVASNATEEGRSKNRRVELVLW